MRIVQRYARVFWAIAILLMVGGQAAHASLGEVDVHCESQHAESTPTDTTPSSEAPAGDAHHCCHFHHPGNFLTWDSASWTRPNFSGDDLSVATIFVPESPLREIDYPPQLS